MKQLLGGILLLVVIAVLGFAYRYITEHKEQIACTEEAKMCPDGTSVGRSGPACEFAPCVFPNIDVKEAELAFALPVGYKEGQPSGDTPTIRFFAKPSLSEGVDHIISVSRHEILEGQTAEDVILQNTRFQPADMQAEDMSKFKPVIVNGKTFQSVVIERFEALVQSSYFLVRSTDVLEFSIIEHDVMDWMEPTLNIDDLTEHKNLLYLLNTLQIN